MSMMDAGERVAASGMSKMGLEFFDVRDRPNNSADEKSKKLLEHLQNFDKLDTNKDGKVTRQELKKVLMRLDVADSMVDNYSRSFFEKYDVDDSGFVTADEMISIIKKAPPRLGRTLPPLQSTAVDVFSMKQSFEEADANGDGVVDLQELTALLIDQGESKTNAAKMAGQVFKLFGEQEDGNIEFKHFYAEYTRMKDFRVLVALKKRAMESVDDLHPDGSISKDALLEALTANFGLSAAERKLEEWFAGIDSDKDGTLTAAELVEYHEKVAKKNAHDARKAAKKRTKKKKQAAAQEQKRATAVEPLDADGNEGEDEKQKEGKNRDDVPLVEAEEAEAPTEAAREEPQVAVPEEPVTQEPVAEAEEVDAEAPAAQEPELELKPEAESEAESEAAEEQEAAVEEPATDNKDGQDVDDEEQEAEQEQENPQPEPKLEAGSEAEAELEAAEEQEAAVEEPAADSEDGQDVDEEQVQENPVAEGKEAPIAQEGEDAPAAAVTEEVQETKKVEVTESTAEPEAAEALYNVPSTWDWKHDAVNSNGEITMHEYGALSTTWGEGTWTAGASGSECMWSFGGFSHTLTLSDDGTLFASVREDDGNVSSATLIVATEDESSRPASAEGNADDDDKQEEE
jgi:Ca2+-binding EF-hand superfamily protein